MKLSQLHTKYLADLGALGRSPATLQAYAGDWKLFFSFLPRDDVRELTRENVADYAAWLSQKGHRPSGIARRLSSVSSFGEWLARRGDVPTNPFHTLPRPKARRANPKPVPEDRLAKLTDLTPRDAALVGVMRYAGLRVGEVGHLDLDDVDLDNGVLQVREGKGGKDRAIPLFDPLPALLRAWLTVRGDTLGPLFPGARVPRLERKAVGRILGRLAENAEIPHFSPHQLRHTFCTSLVRMGVSPSHVQALAGHESLETTQRYVKVTASDLQGLRGKITWGG